MNSTIFQETVNKLAANPRNLFLMDGLGALLSAFLLGVVLANLERVFGIPRPTLYFLAALPCLFAVYDFYCYYSLKGNWRVYVQGIAVVNLIYCGISLVSAFYHRQTITWFGWTYLWLEVLIILVLVLLELKTAARLRNAASG